MIRLLMLGLLVYLGYTLFRSIVRSLTWRGVDPPAAKSSRGEEMVQDSHCGTYFPRSDALEKTIGGRRHYFCSKKCRDAFAGSDQ